MPTVKVRIQTFEDCIEEKPVLELPVLFEGTFEEAKAFCEAQPGYQYKFSRQNIYGGYYYDRVHSLVLLLT